MLKTLHIENIAVIECADVEFSAGLSVLTGETGAGKSIIIDSLNAVLGNRVSRELVRSGTERASVTASFESAQAERWCADNEIDTDEGEIILQRRITADGKTSGRVNGVPVTASQLRELGTLLLDIHGQNDGRQLLDERRHLDYLDAFGECGDALSSYREAYDAYRALVRETERLSMDETEKQRLEESLRYRVAELTKAELRPGEEAELMERRDLLRNSEKLTEYISSALAALYDSDSSAVAQCGDAEYNVSRASAWSADLSETEEIIRGARLAIEDASERLREKQQLLDFSPEEYDRLEERLSQLRRLEKKYSTDEEGLAALLADAERRLDELEYAGDRLAQLEKETAKAYALAEKQAHLMASVKTKKINVSTHFNKTSFLEGVFARGDRRLSEVILRAQKSGCRFDGWDEHFRFDKWMQAFEKCGIDPDWYLRERSYDEVLPWEHIDIGVTKEFFMRENEKAKRGETTPNCREKCAGCGASSFKAGVCFE